MRLLFRRAAVAMSALLCTPVMALTATVTEGGDLHSQAHFMSPRIATVHRLSTVEVLEQRRDWVRIEIDGNRSGWIPEHKLSIATAPPASSAATGAAATGPGAIPGASRMIPRSSPRASNHALILTLGDAAAADAESATAIARLMGVPDANIRQPTAAQLDADGLRQALAGLDARLGNDDRAFIYLAGDGTRPRRDAPCGDAILSADREAFGLTEFAGYVRSLARKVDKLVVKGLSADVQHAGAALGVLVTSADLAVMAATLAAHGRNPLTGDQVLEPDNVRDVLSVMAWIRAEAQASTHAMSDVDDG